MSQSGRGEGRGGGERKGEKWGGAGGRDSERESEMEHDNHTPPLCNGMAENDVPTFVGKADFLGRSSGSNQTPISHFFYMAGLY